MSVPSGPVSPAAAAAGEAPGRATSRYVAISPVRVVDTRSNFGAALQVGAGETRVDPLTPAVLAAAGAVRTDVVAVVVNATLTDVMVGGYLTLWPTGAAAPNASNLNVERSGQTLANVATVPVGVGGAISAINTSGGQLVVDVQGVYVASAHATAGRLVLLPPQRVTDTRATQSPLAAGSTTAISLIGAGVPPSAGAAVLNVTATESFGPGFFTVWPAGDARPVASNLNVDHAQQTVANQVIAKVTNGAVEVFASAGGHLVVDVAGYFTGADSADSATGLFVPIGPFRLLDTRETRIGPLPSNGEVTVPPPFGVHDALAVSLNLTITEAAESGYVTAYAAESARPQVSSVNADHGGQTVANHAVVGVSPTGFALYTMRPGHLIADVSGYFTDGTDHAVAPQGPVAAPRGPHAFTYAAADGRSAGRWDPCTPLSYMVNPAGATPIQLGLLTEVVTAVEAATGIDFVYAGTTTARAYDAGTESWRGPGALIEFSTKANSPSLTSFQAIGLGALAVTNGRGVYGWALIDSGVKIGDMREVLLHEIGHMVGLAHVEDRTQIMNPVLYAHGGYGNGDLEGLWYLGSSQGCLPPIGSLQPRQGAESGPPTLHITP